jgi:hypothetical protein
MKMIVFFTALMICLSSSVFGQYDVVTVTSSSKFEYFETWYKIKGQPNDFYFFSEYDEDINDYIDYFLNHYGSDIKKPTKEEVIDGHKSLTFYKDQGEMRSTTIKVTYLDDFVSIHLNN